MGALNVNAEFERPQAPAKPYLLSGIAIGAAIWMGIGIITYKWMTGTY